MIVQVLIQLALIQQIYKYILCGQSSLIWTSAHCASNPLRVGISTQRTRRPFGPDGHPDWSKLEHAVIFYVLIIIKITIFVIILIIITIIKTHTRLINASSYENWITFGENCVNVGKAKVVSWQRMDKSHLLSKVSGTKVTFPLNHYLSANCNCNFPVHLSECWDADVYWNFLEAKPNTRFLF